MGFTTESTVIHRENHRDAGSRMSSLGARGLAFVGVAGLGAYVLGVGLVAGRLKAQRLVTSFCFPASLVLFGLVFLTAYALFVRRERALSRGLLAVTLFYLLAGNGVLVNTLVGSLETRYYLVRPLDGPVYDAVLVLGGGVGVGPDRVSPELHEAGTRVALAARMVHAGKARHLIVLGSSKPADERAAPSPVELTMTLLRQFGVPDDALLVAHGEITRQEVNAARELVEQRGFERVGLITSAWHLPRAMRLAQSVGLKCDPLPADFRSGPVEWNADFWLPSGEALADLGLVAKERLAGVVGR